MDPFLQVDSLGKNFIIRQGFRGRATVLKAVSDVSFSIAKGETLGLVGESGCGKSTVARMIARLVRPTEGRIVLDGEDVWTAPASERKTLPRKVQMIFQDPYSSLTPRRTVGWSVAEGLLVQGMGDAASRRAKAEELLGWVGLLPEHAMRYPHEFSGGQRQRIAIARALALSPELVICDEPVSSLDVSIQAQVLNLLEDLQARLGLTYLFISHDLAVVSHICDRVAVMYLGQIVEIAPRDELYANPLHPYTRALLTAVPKPDPECGDAVRGLAGEPPSPTAPPSGCPFHPRCADAGRSDACRGSRPGLKEAAPGHFVRCGLNG